MLGLFELEQRIEVILRDYSCGFTNFLNFFDLIPRFVYIHQNFNYKFKENKLK